jgi:hypothetical protein
MARHLPVTRLVPLTRRQVPASPGDPHGVHPGRALAGSVGPTDWTCRNPTDLAGGLHRSAATLLSLGLENARHDCCQRTSCANHPPPSPSSNGRYRAGQLGSRDKSSCDASSVFRLVTESRRSSVPVPSALLEACATGARAYQAAHARSGFFKRALATDCLERRYPGHLDPVRMRTNLVSRWPPPVSARPEGPFRAEEEKP